MVLFPTPGDLPDPRIEPTTLVSPELAGRFFTLSHQSGWLLCARHFARRSNQSILKEISPEYSLEGLMLKLKLQYFGHLMMQRIDSLKKTVMLGKIEGGRRRGDRG